MNEAPRQTRTSTALAGGAVLLAALCTFWSHRPGETPADAGCLSCHRGIETASASHEGCVSCHGGDPAGETKEVAHQGIYGIANTSYAGRWELGCKPCHRHQVERVNSNQMFTNTGMIGQIQATWEGEREGVVYASPPGETHALDGTKVKHTSVGQLDNLSGDLYRKFCSRCHVARHEQMECSACHSRTVVQCYGCHTRYDKRSTGWDFIQGKETEGEFSETCSRRSPVDREGSRRLAP